MTMTLDIRYPLYAYFSSKLGGIVTFITNNTPVSGIILDANQPPRLYWVMLLSYYGPDRVDVKATVSIDGAVILSGEKLLRPEMTGGSLSTTLTTPLAIGTHTLSWSVGSRLNGTSDAYETMTNSVSFIVAPKEVPMISCNHVTARPIAHDVTLRANLKNGAGAPLVGKPVTFVIYKGGTGHAGYNILTDSNGDATWVTPSSLVFDVGLYQYTVKFNEDGVYSGASAACTLDVTRVYRFESVPGGAAVFVDGVNKGTT